MKVLTPEMTFNDEALLLLTLQMSSLPKQKLDDPVGTLARFRTEIMNALDFVLFGI